VKDKRRPNKKNKFGRCYNCGIHGHIAEICSNGEIKPSHQKDLRNEI